MRLLIVIILLISTYIGYSQERISIDSVHNFITPDSISSQYNNVSEFIETRNTELGIVIYEPSRYMLKWNNDTLREKDGFEYYDWKIIESDTLKNGSIILKGVCPSAWPESAYAIFEFDKITEELIEFKRTLYLNNKENDTLIKKVLIVKKSRLENFVCLREPNPNYPGTDLPFIENDFKNPIVAKKEDFKIK